MYRVGFGDFFLMSVPAADGGMAHVLIDCGVHAHDLGVIDDAVTQLKADTGGKLALIIMTHRHADHISGFGSARATFQTFEVGAGLDVVVRGSQGQGRAPHPGRHRRRPRPISTPRSPPAPRRATINIMHMAENALGVAKGGGNAGALDMLHHFKAPGGGTTPVAYYAAGETPVLPPRSPRPGCRPRSSARRATSRWSRRWTMRRINI